MKILVTGATGFIGRHVITELLKNDYLEIIATSLNQQKAKTFDWYPRVQYIPCDLRQPNADVYNLFNQPDILIHLAWQGLPNYQERYHFEENLPANYAFLKNMVAGGLKQLTVTGTCFEYGLQNGCLGEETLPRPVTNYALAKDTLRKFIEALLIDYPAVTFAWLRLFYMFGPGQNPKSLFGQLEQARLNQKPMFNMSGGEQLRDYLPIERMAGYIAQLGLSADASGIINVCSGQPVSIRNLVEKWLENKEATLKLNLGYYPYPSHEPMAFWGNNQKLSALLAKTPA
jgi:nucleoside-diphosphate-sugar epimerase